MVASVKKVVLDVLKPHKPNGLEFSSTLAEKCPDCRVSFDVQAVDENTESVVIVIEGDDLQYDVIAETIHNMGGSVHSIDQVEVINPRRKKTGQ